MFSLGYVIHKCNNTKSLKVFVNSNPKKKIKTILVSIPQINGTRNLVPNPNL